MTTARRHHYVPQGYLASFTDTGTKEGQFWVMEVESGNCFPTSPKNVAVARDFNRVDADELPIDALETALASFEGEAIEVIRKVILSREVGLYGTFEDPLPLVVNLRAEAVAIMNTRSALYAERYVFSCLNTFSIKHEGLVREVECRSDKTSKGRRAKRPGPSTE